LGVVKEVGYTFSVLMRIEVEAAAAASAAAKNDDDEDMTKSISIARRCVGF